MNTLWSNTTYQIHVNVSSMLNDYSISPHYFLTYAFNIFVVIMLHVSHKLLLRKKKMH